jgi:hypothetical protein
MLGSWGGCAIQWECIHGGKGDGVDGDGSPRWLVTSEPRVLPRSPCVLAVNVCGDCQGSVPGGAPGVPPGEARSPQCVWACRMIVGSVCGGGLIERQASTWSCIPWAWVTII